MLYYFEDSIILCFLLAALPVVSLVNLCHIKRNKLKIILACLVSGLTLFFMYNFCYRYTFTLFFILPVVVVFVSRNKNIVELITNYTKMFLLDLFYILLLLITNYILHSINICGNILIYFSILLIGFYMLISFNIFLHRNNNDIFTKFIDINGNKMQALIDTGNKIKYKGQEVVVLDDDYKLVKTNKYIEVNTINSIKKYPLYYIKKMKILDKNNKYYYNVPAIVEKNNKNIILPLKYK